jgi:hypothetical protein
MKRVKEQDFKKPIKVLRESGGSRLPSASKRKTRYVKIYVKVTLALEDHGVFHRTDEQRKNYEPDTSKLHSPRDPTKIMNADLLRLISIGSKRVDDYFKAFYIDTENESTTRGKKVDLSAIVSTAKKGTLTRANLIKLSTGTTKDELKFTKAQLLGQIEVLREKVRQTLPVINEKNASFATVRDTLIKIRKRVFARDPTLAKQLENEAIEKYESITTEEMRETELANIFYTFEGCVSANGQLALKRFEL